MNRQLVRIETLVPILNRRYESEEEVETRLVYFDRFRGQVPGYLIGELEDYNCRGELHFQRSAVRTLRFRRGSGLQIHVRCQYRRGHAPRMIYSPLGNIPVYNVGLIVLQVGTRSKVSGTTVSDLSAVRSAQAPSSLLAATGVRSVAEQRPTLAAAKRVVQFVRSWHDLQYLVVEWKEEVEELIRMMFAGFLVVVEDTCGGTQRGAWKLALPLWVVAYVVTHESLDPYLERRKALTHPALMHSGSGKVKWTVSSKRSDDVAASSRVEAMVKTESTLLEFVLRLCQLCGATCSASISMVLLQLTCPLIAMGTSVFFLLTWKVRIPACTPLPFPMIDVYKLPRPQAWPNRPGEARTARTSDEIILTSPRARGRHASTTPPKLSWDEHRTHGCSLTENYSRLEDQRKRGTCASVMGPWQLRCGDYPQLVASPSPQTNRPVREFHRRERWEARAVRYKMTKRICWGWPNEQDREGDFEVLENVKCSDPHRWILLHSWASGFATTTGRPQMSCISQTDGLFWRKGRGWLSERTLPTFTYGLEILASSRKGEDGVCVMTELSGFPIHSTRSRGAVHPQLLLVLQYWFTYMAVLTVSQLQGRLRPHDGWHRNCNAPTTRNTFTPGGTAHSGCFVPLTLLVRCDGDLQCCRALWVDAQPVGSWRDSSSTFLISPPTMGTLIEPADQSLLGEAAIAGVCAHGTHAVQLQDGSSMEHSKQERLSATSSQCLQEPQTSTSSHELREAPCPVIDVSSYCQANSQALLYTSLVILHASPISWTGSMDKATERVALEALAPYLFPKSAQLSIKKLTRNIIVDGQPGQAVEPRECRSVGCMTEPEARLNKCVQVALNEGRGTWAAIQPQRVPSLEQSKLVVMSQAVAGPVLRIPTLAESARLPDEMHSEATDADVSLLADKSPGEVSSECVAPFIGNERCPPDNSEQEASNNIARPVSSPFLDKSLGEVSSQKLHNVCHVAEKSQGEVSSCVDGSVDCGGSFASDKCSMADHLETVHELEKYRDVLRVQCRINSTLQNEVLFTVCLSYPRTSCPYTHKHEDEDVDFCVTRRVWRCARMKGHWGYGIFPRKPSDQWHRPARFPHAKIPEQPHWELNPVHLELCLLLPAFLLPSPHLVTLVNQRRLVAMSSIKEVQMHTSPAVSVPSARHLGTDQIEQSSILTPLHSGNDQIDQLSTRTACNAPGTGIGCLPAHRPTSEPTRCKYPRSLPARYGSISVRVILDGLFPAQGNQREDQADFDMLWVPARVDSYLASSCYSARTMRAGSGTTSSAVISQDLFPAPERVATGSSVDNCLPQPTRPASYGVPITMPYVAQVYQQRQEPQNARSYYQSQTSCPVARLPTQFSIQGMLLCPDRTNYASPNPQGCVPACFLPKTLISLGRYLVSLLSFGELEGFICDENLQCACAVNLVTVYFDDPSTKLRYGLGHVALRHGTKSGMGCGGRHTHPGLPAGTRVAPGSTAAAASRISGSGSLVVVVVKLAGLLILVRLNHGLAVPSGTGSPWRIFTMIWCGSPAVSERESIEGLESEASPVFEWLKLIPVGIDCAGQRDSGVTTKVVVSVKGAEDFFGGRWLKVSVVRHEEGSCSRELQHTSWWSELLSITWRDRSCALTYIYGPCGSLQTVGYLRAGVPPLAVKTGFSQGRLEVLFPSYAGCIAPMSLEAVLGWLLSLAWGLHDLGHKGEDGLDCLVCGYLLPRGMLVTLLRQQLAQVGTGHARQLAELRRRLEERRETPGQRPLAPRGLFELHVGHLQLCPTVVSELEHRSLFLSWVFCDKEVGCTLPQPTSTLPVDYHHSTVYQVDVDHSFVNYLRNKLSRHRSCLFETPLHFAAPARQSALVLIFALLGKKWANINEESLRSQTPRDQRACHPVPRGRQDKDPAIMHVTSQAPPPRSWAEQTRARVMLIVFEVAKAQGDPKGGNPLTAAAILSCNTSVVLVATSELDDANHSRGCRQQRVSTSAAPRTSRVVFTASNYHTSTLTFITPTSLQGILEALETGLNNLSNTETTEDKSLFALPSRAKGRLPYEYLLLIHFGHSVILIEPTDLSEEYTAIPSQSTLPSKKPYVHNSDAIRFDPCSTVGRRSAVTDQSRVPLRTTPQEACEVELHSLSEEGSRLEGCGFLQFAELLRFPHNKLHAIVTFLSPDGTSTLGTAHCWFRLVLLSPADLPQLSEILARQLLAETGVVIGSDTGLLVLAGLPVVLDGLQLTRFRGISSPHNSPPCTTYMGEGHTGRDYGVPHEAGDEISPVTPTSKVQCGGWSALANLDVQPLHHVCSYWWWLYRTCAPVTFAYLFHSRVAIYWVIRDLGFTTKMVVSVIGRILLRGLLDEGLEDFWKAEVMEYAAEYTTDVLRLRGGVMVQATFSREMLEVIVSFCVGCIAPASWALLLAMAYTALAAMSLGAPCLGVCKLPLEASHPGFKPRSGLDHGRMALVTPRSVVRKEADWKRAGFMAVIVGDAAERSTAARSPKRATLCSSLLVPCLTLTGIEWCNIIPRLVLPGDNLANVSSSASDDPPLLRADERCWGRVGCQDYHWVCDPNQGQAIAPKQIPPPAPRCSGRDITQTYCLSLIVICLIGVLSSESHLRGSLQLQLSSN
ncbi:hypothetical protein PR048_026895 [Dryococelus australis]|uniref:Uncharacterized protein n=1 Tax=Dryococelus australis TaxID=614101 RepID=A0ABQ9GMK0_9NEOP|nr:hypothetical protein PR048_026895 [Dryococelus australis]